MRPDDPNDAVRQGGPREGVRRDTLKELPTLAEARLPGFQVVVWHGVYAPKGTPRPVIDKLVAASPAAIQDPGFGRRMNDHGAQVVTRDKATPDGLRNRLKAEIERRTPIIRKAGPYAE